MHIRTRPVPTGLVVVCAVIGLIASTLIPSVAVAGGGAERALLVIDPADQESLYLGHYYQQARGIPDGNVVYMPPAAANYNDHVSYQQRVVFGTLANRAKTGQIDYIIVAPCDRFYVDAPGLVSDGCASVSRFALSSVYTFSWISDTVLAGTSSSQRNGYYSTAMQPMAFAAERHWRDGSPAGYPADPQYFIGALLGYLGERGNTLEDIVALIDRSVAVDGTQPAGSFYFMETTDSLRSAPRHGTFATVVSAIQSLGGQAEHQHAILPDSHDCLGIMTGWASPDIDGHDFTILPGAFCDHLTSYAATFSTSAQTKISQWIAAGASGSVGAVQEPCNYSGKFPHARLHAHYLQGTSLGEAAFASLSFLPFQMLLYGDPLTQPFAMIPQVEVQGVPTAPVSGSVTITPQAVSPAPGTAIAHIDVFVDDTWVARTASGSEVELDTTRFADGVHELRAVAMDDSCVSTQGRWTGTVRTANHGRSASLSVAPTSGDLVTMFGISAGGAGAAVSEIRLEGAGRVLAASQGLSETSFDLRGVYLGGGPQNLKAIVTFVDGTMAVSDPVAVDVFPAGEPTGTADEHAPVAYSYCRDICHGAPLSVELPACDFEGGALTFQIVAPPATGTLSGDGPTRFFIPDEGACGTDSFSYTVYDGTSTSEAATVTLRYTFKRGDFNEDGRVDIADFQGLQTCFTGRHGQGPLQPACRACFDWDADGHIEFQDYARFAELFGTTLSND